MNGLDLFSGIGGNSIALRGYVKTVAYCEKDRYAQSVLLSRMADGSLIRAPIWDDITSLTGAMLPSRVDIITGGFPCQDISLAGNGRGLDGERSGLVFEVFRLIEEIKPKFVFLENVPAIRTRGAERVVKELAELGYDCRWDLLSAYDVGAPHKRERWFLLAFNPNHRDENKIEEVQRGKIAKPSGVSLDDALSGRYRTQKEQIQARRHSPFNPSWWTPEPCVDRVADGVPSRVDRIRCLGNAVVPAQAREAFERLMGLK